MRAEIWANVISGTGLMGLVSAALLGVRQLRLSRYGGGGANLMALWDRLQSDAARANRRKLYEAIEVHGPFEPGKWSEADREAAGHVCQLWSVAGRLAREDVIPAKIIVAEWHAVIIRCWNETEPVIRWERSRRRDPTLWRSFEWLASQARSARRP